MRKVRTLGRFGESSLPVLSWRRAYRLHGRWHFCFVWHECEPRCNRMMALQPNQKIEYPHPPANGETVADISAKHCVHCGRKTEHIARREKNFDELLRVPCVHKPKINIHCAIYGSLVPREQPFRLVRMIENFVKRVGGKFTAEHGQENATAKNWIDEPGSIACEQPAIAAQSRAAIGEIRFHINFRGAPCVGHPFGDDWLLSERLIEKFSSAEFRLAKRFAVENHSYAGAVGGDWNQPEPTIDGTDQDCERAVNSFRAPDTIVVRED